MKNDRRESKSAMINGAKKIVTDRFCFASILWVFQRHLDCAMHKKRARLRSRISIGPLAEPGGMP
jgi:hypothetical protein